jgi:hypothetical protein
MQARWIGLPTGSSTSAELLWVLTVAWEARAPQATAEPSTGMVGVAGASPFRARKGGLCGRVLGGKLVGNWERGGHVREPGIEIWLERQVLAAPGHVAGELAVIVWKRRVQVEV